MHATAHNLAPQTARTPDPREVLDEGKKRQFMQMGNATLRELATAFDPEPATEDLSVQAAVLGLSARAAVAAGTDAPTVAAPRRRRWLRVKRAARRGR